MRKRVVGYDWTINVRHLCILTMAVLTGCGATLQEAPPISSSVYMARWYRMKNYPLSMCEGRWGAHGAPWRETTSGGLAPFLEAKQYGRFKALVRYGKALLLDEQGREVWAGSWIIPLRLRGRLGSLLLLDAYRLESENVGEGAIYHVSWLLLGEETTYIRLADAYLYDFGEGGLSTWVADADGDGTDEVLMAVPRHTIYWAQTDEVKWDLVLYSTRLNSEAGGLAAPNTHTSEEVSYRASFLAGDAALRIPLKSAPGRLRVERGDPKGRGFRVYLDRAGQQELGLITWNGVDGRWVVGTK